MVCVGVPKEKKKKQPTITMAVSNRRWSEASTATQRDNNAAQDNDAAQDNGGMALDIVQANVGRNVTPMALS